ncbi:MAG: hypothetical protein M3Q81_04240 [bacterium]|nr:hypothetical protein [bacterium]
MSKPEQLWIHKKLLGISDQPWADYAATLLVSTEVISQEARLYDSHWTEIEFMLFTMAHLHEISAERFYPQVNADVIKKVRVLHGSSGNQYPVKIETAFPQHSMIDITVLSEARGQSLASGIYRSDGVLLMIATGTDSDYAFNIPPEILAETDPANPGFVKYILHQLKMAACETQALIEVSTPKPVFNFFDSDAAVAAKMPSRVIEGEWSQPLPFFGDTYEIAQDETETVVRIERERRNVKTIAFPTFLPPETRQQMIKLSSTEWSEWDWINQIEVKLTNIDS